jgi:hypothetical protein
MLDRSALYECSAGSADTLVTKGAIDQHARTSGPGDEHEQESDEAQ